VIEATYLSHMGDDLAVANAARVSFAKHAERFRDQDARLLRFLARNGHWTPFGHPQVSLRCRAPIFTARQAFKSKVGFVENEVSRRYVDAPPEFFMPDRWRGRAEDKKQGSSDVDVLYVQLDPGVNVPPSLVVEDCYRTCRETYHALIQGGVAPEQARMVLPQAMMTEWVWTGSLAAFARFCRLRQAKDAQAEISELAWRVADVLGRLFPVSWAVLSGCELQSVAEGDAA